MEGEAEDFLLVVDELILTEHAEPKPLCNGDGAAVRGEVAAQNPEQRGLARTVGADESVPLGRVELERCPGEQGPVTERFREVGNGDHCGGNLTAVRPPSQSQIDHAARKRSSGTVEDLGAAPRHTHADLESASACLGPSCWTVGFTWCEP